MQIVIQSAVARRPAAISSSPRLPELVYPSADAPIASLRAENWATIDDLDVRSLSTTGVEEVLAILAEEVWKTLLLMGVGETPNSAGITSGLSR